MEAKTPLATALTLVDSVEVDAASTDTPWRSRSYWLKYSPLALIITLSILATIVGAAGAHNWVSDSSTTKYFQCDPNGKVWVADGRPPNYWHAEYALSITFGFGKYSYSAAKAIDVTWDIVVGRAGQALVAALIYGVFRRALVLAMKDHALSYESFIAMQYATVTASAILAYAKGVRRAQSRVSPRQVTTALALVFCASYALAFPTWLSAMTGYQAITTAVLRQANGTSVSLDELRPSSYILVDGGRVGQRSACVPADTDLSTAVANYSDIYWTRSAGILTLSVPGSTSASAGEASSFTFSNRTYPLLPPLLNITTLPIDPYSLYTYQNRTIALDDIIHGGGGLCQPQKHYRWGFSFLLLFTYLVVTCVFTIVVYCVWLDTLRYKLDRHTSHLYGTLSTALEVGASIREELGHEANGLQDGELRHRLRHRGAGMRLRRSEPSRVTDQVEESKDARQRLSISSASTFRVEEFGLGDP
ncbi:hypothetical protein LTR85_010845 [Meristemomyces frigidus]|nr:hypothetical protein LTR85_010845 [Meristemomyces frigidus]